MLLDDGTTVLPSGYGQTWLVPEGVPQDWTPRVSFERGDRLEDVSITFPISESELAGHEFIIHLNAGLLRLRSGDKDFDSYTVPRRFRLRKRTAV